MKFPIKKIRKESNEQIRNNRKQNKKKSRQSINMTAKTKQSNNGVSTQKEYINDPSVPTSGQERREICLIRSRSGLSY